MKRLALVASGVLVMSSAQAAGAALWNFYGVYSSSSSLDSNKLRALLKTFENTPLVSGCPTPRADRSLAGFARVRGKLTTTGKLTITSLSAYGDHQTLDGCLRQAIASWRFSQSAADAGTEIRFNLYIGRAGAQPAAVSDQPVRSNQPAPIPPKQHSKGLIGGLGTGGGAGGIGVVGGRYPRSSYYRSSAKLASVSSRGGLQLSMVNWAIEQLHLESNARYCHQTAAKRRPDLQGSYAITLRVGKSGMVEKIDLTRDTLRDSAVFACLARYLFPYTSYTASSAKTPFPPSRQATTIKIAFDFPVAEQR